MEKIKGYWNQFTNPPKWVKLLACLLFAMTACYYLSKKLFISSKGSDDQLLDDTKLESLQFSLQKLNSDIKQQFVALKVQLKREILEEN